MNEIDKRIMEYRLAAARSVWAEVLMCISSGIIGALVVILWTHGG